MRLDNRSPSSWPQHISYEAAFKAAQRRYPTVQSATLEDMVQDAILAGVQDADFNTALSGAYRRYHSRLVQSLDVEIQKAISAESDLETEELIKCACDGAEFVEDILRDRVRGLELGDTARRLGTTFDSVNSRLKRFRKSTPIEVLSKRTGLDLQSVARRSVLSAR